MDAAQDQTHTFNVQFKRQWEDRHVDPTGSTTMLYPQGLTVDVPNERAAYLLAIDYVTAIDPIDETMQAAVDELKHVVEHLRSRAVEPSIDAVYMTYAEILAEQQAQAGKEQDEMAAQGQQQPPSAPPAATEPPAEREIIPDSQEVPDVEAQPAPAKRKR